MNNKKREIDDLISINNQLIDLYKKQIIFLERINTTILNSELIDSILMKMNYANKNLKKIQGEE